MKFCSNCLNLTILKDRNAIEVIKREYVKNDIPWYLGFSGGKDSSALLTLLVNALLELKNFHKEVTVIYCDTGVEIPIISEYVKRTIHKLKKEIKKLEIPIKFKIVEPDLRDRYFVKVIGRGYPPPTNKFRWCTDRLRINPVKKIINSKIESIVLLGVRKGESKERDKTLNKHDTGSQYYLNQSGVSNTKIFSPVIEFNLNDIWTTLKYNHFPESIDIKTIGQLYKDAGTECPVFRETKGTPCGSGRFGCWTCTVVRQDKSVSSLVDNGYLELDPLYRFRNWLILFRDNKEYRCRYRRNGQKSLGPLTLNGRRIILKKLLKIQTESKIELLKKDEIKIIKEYWSMDRKNISYRE